MDYYKILQVSNEAEPEVIEAAYKKLSAKYHPDKNHSADADERMKQINEAYSVLRNPVTRAEYDKWLVGQTHQETLPATTSANDWLNTILTFASSLNESLGSPCPNCGTKSLIHQKKLDKSIFDYLTGDQKYQCRNCGQVYKL